MIWRRFVRRAAWDAERAREIEAHLAHHVDDLVARGLSPADARRTALRKFGNPSAVREDIYEMNSIPILETLWRDARYAWRMLRKTPAFTLTVGLTLAVGIGANTAIFSVVDSLLLRPLPYPGPERLAIVATAWHSPRGEGRRWAQDGRTWELMRDTVTEADCAVFSTWVTGVNAVVRDRALYVQQQRVGAGYFRMLGVLPRVGREFMPEEDLPAGPPVAVLSHAFWTRALDADPSIVGEPILLRGEPYTVVGIMPDGFLSTAPADLWTPLRPSTSGEGGGTNYAIGVRIGPKATWTEVDAQVAAAGRARAAEYRNADGVTFSFLLSPMRDFLTSDVRTPLLVLWAAVGLVLLLVCANIAGLMLARAGRRAREIATRLALGSGRRAVVRQLLVESAVLAVVGGLAGAVFGHFMLQSLRWLASDYGLWQPISVDARALVITAGVALATSIAFGLAPALSSTRVDVNTALAETSARGATGRAAHWPRRLLVAGEVAIGVLLVVSAALLVRTFVNLRGLDPGLDPRGVVTARFSMQDARYASAEAMNAFFSASLDRIRALPGVEAAGIALGQPYDRLLNLGFDYVGEGDDEQQFHLTNLSYVTPGYFEALRQPVLRGRGIDDTDRAGSLPVAVVNQAFIETYFKGREALGSRITVAGGEREIVGVIGDVQQRFSGIGASAPLKPTPTIYIAAAQTTGGFLAGVHTWFQPSWVVRSSAPTADVVAGIQRAVREVDPQLPIAAFMDLGEAVNAALAPQRFLMTLLTTLGAMAALLAVLGIYGLVASSVVERTRELGIRLALGATLGQAVRTVVVPGIGLAVAGTLVGIGAALAGDRVLASFLWGVSASDPATFAVVGAGLVAVAAAASLLPALRVLRLDPATTLRHE